MPIWTRRPRELRAPLGRAASAKARPRTGLLGWTLLWLWITAAPALAGQSSALWHVVHDLCVVDYKATGLPAPCAKVDLARGYVVLKDLRGKTQMLLIPTQRVSGIESPALLTAGAPNYFALAWRARGLFEHRAGKEVPRDEMALAVNSVPGRSQDQLHIHIDCIRPDVRAALAAAAPKLGAWWSAPDLTLAGRRYRALRLEGDDPAADPFRLLAALPAARADMADQTLVLAGMEFDGGRPGFILLAHRADPAKGDQGAGEELLDHACSVLASPVPASAPAGAVSPPVRSLP